MKFLFFIFCLFICLTSFGQVSNSLVKNGIEANKYKAIQALQPDSSQIINTVAPFLLKTKYGKVGMYDSTQIIHTTDANVLKKSLNQKALIPKETEIIYL